MVGTGLLPKKQESRQASFRAVEKSPTTPSITALSRAMRKSGAISQKPK